MSTLKVPANVPNGRIELSSTWKAKLDVSRNNKGNIVSKYVFESGPTAGTARVSFPYSLPSGAVVKSSKMWATAGSPYSGCSSRTVNGNGFNQTRGGEVGADVTLTGATGTLEAIFSFKANGTLKDENSHASTLILSNVYLEIEYTGEAAPSSDSTEQKKENDEILSPPPQGVCIYDSTDGSIYTFDGVVKINHTLSMDLQEEPEGEKKAKYVNNAKNEPDKLTLDVMMSDVYTGGTVLDMSGYMNNQQSAAMNASKTAVVSEGFTRSGVFFHALHWLKEQRRKLAVITPQYVHVDMIIASVTVNQDENTPFGWEGQIVFQHAFEPKEVKKQVSKGGKTGNDTKDQSVSSQALDKISGKAEETIKKSGTGKSSKD